MEKRKNSLSLKAGVKNRKSKDTPINAATPRQKGSSGGKGILKCAASNQTNQPLSPLSKSGSYLGNLPQTLEKRPNDSFDFHCSFETDGGSGQEADIPCTQPVSQDKILEGVVAFIEARTNTENRFEGISKQMEMLGATVAKKFTLEVTHVVFKDGKKTTRDKALKKGIHLVSVLWVESCRQSGKRVSEDLFPVVLPEEVGTPLMIGKLKRTKSMQPKAFDEDVRNSAERGDRRRRRKVAADNLSPSAMIFCEETQAPYSPLVVSYPLATPHVVPDTPCHSSATAFPFKKALDYEEDSHQETSKPQEPIESNTEEADQSQHSTEEPPVKIAKLKRRLLSNRTPATPATTLTEPTKTPATAKRQTPTDVLLTGSGQGKKRKRVASLNTGESQCVEGKEGLPKEKKKVRLGGHVVVFDGDCLPNAGDGSEKQSVDHEPGASCKNKESLTENPDVKKPMGDVSKKKKTKTNGNTKQQRRNRISQGDNDEGASDSGVSVADDTSTVSIKDCESKLSKGRFSKTAKLVGQVTEMGDVDELTNLEEHECRKKENTRETTTGAVKKRQIFKPGKLVRQVKEHEVKDTKSKPDGVLEESDKMTGNIVAGRKGKVRNIESLEGGEELSEDDDNDDDDDEGETCTEDEEQQCVNNENTTSKTKRDKLVKKLKPKRSIVMTSMHFGEQDIVVSVVRKLGAFFIEDRVSSTTSHVITGSPRRTLNLMMAIAHGCWLVSPTWIMKSLEVGYWVDEEPYELSDAFPAAQLCRLERVSAGPGYSQDLFSDCAPIFVSENCSPPSDSLMTLINLCGGKVCTSVRKAGICIGSMSRRTQAVNITEQWLLDCITQHAVLSFTKYALNSPAKRTRETSPSY